MTFEVIKSTAAFFLLSWTICSSKGSYHVVMTLKQPCAELFLVAQAYLTLCDPTDHIHSLPDSSVHGDSQARIPKWVAYPFSRASSQPRNQPGSPALQDSLPAELPGKPPSNQVSMMRERLAWWGTEASCQQQVSWELSIHIHIHLYVPYTVLIWRFYVIFGKTAVYWVSIILVCYGGMMWDIRETFKRGVWSEVHLKRQVFSKWRNERWECRVGVEEGNAAEWRKG